MGADEEAWRREAFERQAEQTRVMEAELAAARAAERVDQAKRAEVQERKATAAAGGKESKRRTIISCKEEVIAGQEAARLAAAMEGGIARMVEAARKQRLILLAQYGTYLNLPELHHLLGHREATDHLWQQAQKDELSYDGIQHAVVLAQEVERLCDSGRFGVELLGILEIFTVEAFADWTGDALTLLGFLRARGVGESRRDMTFWFEHARQQALMSGGMAPGLTRAWSGSYLDWCCREGELAKGPVATLEQCLPLEIGWRHKAGAWGGSVYFIRDLKNGLRARSAKPEDEGRAVTSAG